MRNIILVFDMDQTIIGNWDINNLDINPRILEILKYANNARTKGIVLAIFLLTNNSDTEFINNVVDILNTLVDSEKLFDYILARGGNNKRNGNTEDPTKSLDDVRYMLKECGIIFNGDLPSSVFFFDDRNDHNFADEIPTENYIHITPPYRNDLNDKTNLLKIKKLLISPNGGYKKSRRKSRRNKRKSRRLV